MESHLMIKYSIILVPFPFDDFSNSKVRPAICLTSAIGDYEHIIIAFISSKIPDELLKSDIMIRINEPSISSTGLLVDSIIRLHKVVTIPKHLIKRRLGFADNELIAEISKKIKVLFEV